MSYFDWADNISDINSEDILDTRDLETIRNRLKKDLKGIKRAKNDDESIQASFELLDLLDELEQEVPEWERGNALIREDHFEDYAQQEAEDCGFIDDDNPLLSFIDWSAWAANLLNDYSSIEIGDETYYYRNC